MTETEKINNWKVPVWHKDYGNPNLEVQLLKELCIYIINLGLVDYSFEIEYIEEGYLCVSIFKNKHYFGEFQVVDIEENKIGLFTQNGEEFYIYNSNEIKKFLL